MPTGEPPHIGPAPSIFISYASQDRDAARILRDALAAAGLDVWYDESELGGGDAWDQKIRSQIRECRYFMPVISANTNARHEGYFRREWRLAAERTLDMADDVAFILPVTIDSTPQGQARVPDKFVSVQWLSLPGGRPTPALDSMCRRLLGAGTGPAAAPPAPARGGPVPPRVGVHEYPHFPEQKPGHTLHFLFLVVGWALRTSFVWCMRLPKGRRRLVITILALLLLDRMCSSESRTVHVHQPTAEEKAKAQKILSDLGQKFDTASQSKDGKGDLSKVGADIAGDLSKALGSVADDDPDILAVPFTAPDGDESAARFSGTVFASLFGQLSIEKPGKVALDQAKPGSPPADPLAAARARGADKVLTGLVTGAGDQRRLEVTLEDGGEGKVLWSGSYALAGAQPTDIANEIRSHVYPEK